MARYSSITITGGSKLTKDIIAAIEERTSVRRFKSDPVPSGTIGRLLQAACRAPSAGNIQPWLFVVVTKEAVLRQLAKAAGGQNFLLQAPVCIVVCAEPKKSAAKYGDRGSQLFCIQDTAAAIQNLLLTATGYGLGTCWVGSFNEEEVREALELGPEYRPMALIPVGYPDQEITPRARRSTDEVIRFID